MKVGWIGAGRMGAQMALRAARAGHGLTVFAHEVSLEAELRASGVVFARSAVEAVQGAQVVCINVFSDDQARELLLTEAGGPTEALAAIPLGATLVLHTSGAARLAHQLAVAAPRGVKVLDAPFSGQDDHVREGALTIVVGGDPDALRAVRPVLESYGREIVHAGALGAGREVKLVNQFLYRANQEAAAAALDALRAKGVDPALAVQAMATCSGASWALQGLGNGPSMAERRRGFARYLDVYQAAAEEDALDVSVLDRMARVAQEASDGL